MNKDSHRYRYSLSHKDQDGDMSVCQLLAEGSKQVPTDITNHVATEAPE